MKILVRQATIADPGSAFNGQISDILIEGSTITKINPSSSGSPVNKDDFDSVIDIAGTIVSPGWVDIFADFADPGYEYRETLSTGAAAAAAGGFTRVFTIPNTKPVVDNKTQVEYIARQSYSLPVDIHPIGSVTKAIEGKELAEMYDMKNSGAVAFSDGIQPVQSPGLFVKALQYTKAFDGVLIQVPVDKSIGSGGLMNEGVLSTQLGLPGLPALAEEIIIKRDIDLLRYTQSKLHITGISTSNSIRLINDARKEGLQITCSVTPYHLFFCDEDLAEYDTNLKVNPPLRSRNDMMALRQAVINGDIDCIATHHFPHNKDNKNCEFEYAKNGMTGLETAYAAINTVLPELSNEQLVKLFSLNARNIFTLPAASIAEGATAELSLFSRTESWILQKHITKSRSFNTPFAKSNLTGKVIGIINKGNLILN